MSQGQVHRNRTRIDMDQIKKISMNKVPVGRIQKGMAEFQKFVMRGNVLDLAIGVIMGGAFGKIVTSLVGDILMPALGILLPHGFTNLKWIVIKANESKSIAEVAIRYGAFIQSIVDFLIIGASVYLFIRLAEKMRKKQDKTAVATVVAAPAEPTQTEKLLSEIRDLLKNK